MLSPEFRREAKSLAFIVMLLVFFYFAVTEKANGLKEDVNTGVQAQCLASAPSTAEIFRKYDDVVKSLVEHEQVSEKKDLKDHLGPNAANDAALVARLKADRIQIVKQDCSKPFLP